MYLENNLRVPGKLDDARCQGGLGKVDMPSLPAGDQAKTTSCPGLRPTTPRNLVGGEVHLRAGRQRAHRRRHQPGLQEPRSYWSGGQQGDDAEAWLASAKETPGSWWPLWTKWLSAHAGKAVPARKRLGNAKYKPIEPAPGRYVKVRANSSAN
jgi:polyhydroxyalkanoate synthase